MAMRSGLSALVCSTTRRTSFSRMVGPTCRSVIWAMEKPERVGGSEGSRMATSSITAGPVAPR